MGPFEFILALAAMLLAFIYYMARSGIRRTDARYNQSDTELMQEIFRGLERMEKRVETLETLLLDRTERGEHAQKER